MIIYKFLIAASLIIILSFSLIAQPQTEVVIDRESTEIGFLDRQRSGIVLFSTGYRAIPSTKGFNFDLLITPIVGEIYGSRKEEGKKKTTFANAGFAQLITFDMKYNYNTEKIKLPAISTGLITSLALSWDTDDDYKRPSLFYGLYAACSKIYWRKKNARAHFGIISDNYAKGFSYLTEYYEPNKSITLYAGTDIDLFNKFGIYLEIAKPVNDSQSPLIINFRIKDSLPLLTFSFVKTSSGSSLVGYLNLRLSLFPPITSATTEQEREKIEMLRKSDEWDRQMKDIKL